MGPLGERHLGEILIEEGQITEEQLEKVLDDQRESLTYHHLGTMMVEEGLISREQLHIALAHKFNIPYVSLREFEIDDNVLSKIPSDLALQYNVLPLAENDGKLIVAIENPLDWDALDAIRFNTNRSAEVVVTSARDISLALNRHYSEFDENTPLDEFELSPVSGANAFEEESYEDDLEQQAMQKPVVRLLNAIMWQAVRRKASDINIRPEKDRASVYYRIDGVLQFVRTLHKSLLAPLVSRIKITGRMNIAEHRLPQDGHARLVKDKHPIDLRISVMPTVHGESAVIRLLDKEVGLRPLEVLGFGEHEVDTLRDLITKPHGMVLVTGPTGSGKSTTLYSLLNEVKRQNPHIITVEDPVEYAMDGVEQIQISNVKGYTFAEALRHILRHDPDVIMVGEIRDLETAQIANKAALTGHLMLSTLHTNDAISSVTRLIDMGVEPFLLSSTLLGAMAQRLVRVICEECKEVDTIDTKLRQTLGVSDDEIFYRGRGCPTCSQSGYRGRVAVCEIFTVTPEIQQLIHANKGEQAIREALHKAGMTTLFEDALELAREGRTTLEEAYKVRTVG
ncbi:hypothetical protein BOW53_07055 [Solemya pervernicosa gill symbiont]|uniref:Bacterial type II secretion system protein E domain-containing protein n=1 Tax=Solemya pervernicosa gill symbiont TaxID=642797 RepID=A0A1T2L685_9GAMM|nr:hypothetical protein BOW53_07055 [Solemya pervernicosa gill symbiont]